MSPASEIVWWGALKGRTLSSPSFGARSPATLHTAETSIASSSARGGRIVGSRRASSVFPAPGGPIMRTLGASEGEGREVGDHGGLAAVGGGEEEAVEPLAAAGERDGQHAAHRLDLAVEGELADQEETLEGVTLHQSRGSEDSQGDREVEGGTFLSEIRGGKADRDALHGA